MKKVDRILLLSFIILFSAGAFSQQYTPYLERFPDNLKNRNVFKRFAWHYQQRAYPYDTIPGTHYRQEMRREVDKVRLMADRDGEGCRWRSIGPHGFPYDAAWGDVSGRARALAVHPTDPNTAYIGAACGGIWKTIDGGASWMDIGHNLESQAFGAIAIDPEDPRIVYAGSGEACEFGMFIIFTGRGLFRSTDGGGTWTKINNGIGEFTCFSDIEVSPHDPDVVICTLTDGSFFTGTSMPNEGIWKSIDKGLTWVRTLDVPDAWDILFHPDDPDIVYAAIGGLQATAGFYISTDQGNTWTVSNAGLPDPNLIGRMQIDLARSDPATLYAVISSVVNWNIGLCITWAYKSVDAGNTWYQISYGVPLGGASFSIDQGFYDLCIAVDPEDPNHVILGNSRLHITTNGTLFVLDNGISGSGMTHCDMHNMKYAPSDPDCLYLTCDGGVYKSVNAGGSFSSVNKGLTTLQYYRVASHPTDSLTVLGGMQDNGVNITQDGGQSWKLSFSEDGMESFFDHTNPSLAFSSFQQGGLLYSPNGGLGFNYWTSLDAPWITPFFMHPSDHHCIYAAGRHVMRFITGSGFEIISPYVAPDPAMVSSMAQSHVNPDMMILASGQFTLPTYYPLSADSLFRVKISTDGGFNWTDVTENIPGEIRYISRVVTDPNDANTMYVLRTGFSPGNKVYRTADLGLTWTNLTGDLPDIPCSDLFVDPREAGHLYLATDIGVYRSTDGGATWQYQGDGIPIVPVFDFDYAEYLPARILRIATHGRSIYQTYLSPWQGIGDECQSTLTVKHYPDPFSEYTVFTYSLKEPGQVTFRVYNEYGQLVAEPVNGMQKQGEQRLQLNSGNLPSGIYFYRLTANGSTANGKMVVVR